MATEEEVKRLLDRVEKATKGKKHDLSCDEGLSVAIMNLIVVEEHLFLTSEKTNKDVYLDLLNEVRTMRKRLMREIITEVEGETWCVTKHLMAASMRLMESGTKQLQEGNKEKAKEMFHKAYQLYSLFWAINLNIVSTKEAKENDLVPERDIQVGGMLCSSCGVELSAEDAASEKEEKPPERPTAPSTAPAEEKKPDSLGKKDFLAKISDIVSKAVNCCKE
jgi:hypothetical protein